MAYVESTSQRTPLGVLKIGLRVEEGAQRGAVTLTGAGVTVEGLALEGPGLAPGAGQTATLRGQRGQLSVSVVVSRENRWGVDVLRASVLVRAGSITLDPIVIYLKSDVPNVQMQAQTQAENPLMAGVRRLGQLIGEHPVISATGAGLVAYKILKK